MVLVCWTWWQDFLALRVRGVVREGVVLAEAGALRATVMVMGAEQLHGPVQAAASEGWCEAMASASERSMPARCW
jgi:hypothetical protein